MSPTQLQGDGLCSLLLHQAAVYPARVRTGLSDAQHPDAPCHKPQTAVPLWKGTHELCCAVQSPVNLTGCLLLCWVRDSSCPLLAPGTAARCCVVHCTCSTTSLDVSCCVRPEKKAAPSLSPHWLGPALQGASVPCPPPAASGLPQQKKPTTGTAMTSAPSTSSCTAQSTSFTKVGADHDQATSRLGKGPQAVPQLKGQAAADSAGLPAGSKQHAFVTADLESVDRKKTPWWGCLPSADSMGTATASYMTTVMAGSVFVQADCGRPQALPD